MPYLQRINYRPSAANLTLEQEQFLNENVQIYGAEIVVYDKPVRWEFIDEVEVVVAPRMKGPAGWLVKKLVLHDETRYHVGIYYGSQEVVVPNIAWNLARHIVESIAFYAPKQIVYTGPEDLAKLTEI